MDRFLQTADIQTFGSSNSETFNFDGSEETFNEFMKKIPIWDFAKTSKDHHLSLPRDKNRWVNDKLYSSYEKRN